MGPIMRGRAGPERLPARLFLASIYLVIVSQHTVSTSEEITESAASWMKVQVSQLTAVKRSLVCVAR